MTAAISFRLQNILDHGGIPVSVAGLLVVFAGLTLVSLFIAGLPSLLDLLDRICKRCAESVPAEDAAEEERETIDRERAVAIATVLEHVLTPEDGSAVQRITIRRCESECLWRNAFWIRSLGSTIPARKARR